MTKDEYIKFLEAKIKRLEKQVTDYSWKLYPDRMGGAFTEDEIRRANNSW
jgi:hypothetical protein